MGTDCSGRWHFCELCCLLGINGSKTAAVCIATDRKAAHLCQGVGEMGGGVSLFVWNGRVVWARRAPAGSTTSAPSCCLLSSMGALGEGWTDPQGPRCGGALAWRCLAELGLLCGLSRGTWRAWVWALNWVSWVKSQERLLFKVLTYPPSCHDCLSNVSQVNTTWHCWSSLFLGKKRCFQKNSFLLTKWTRVLPSLC